MAAQGRRDGHAAESTADRDAGVATIALDYCNFNDEADMIDGKKCSDGGKPELPYTDSGNERPSLWGSIQ